AAARRRPTATRRGGASGPGAGRREPPPPPAPWREPPPSRLRAEGRTHRARDGRAKGRGGCEPRGLLVPRALAREVDPLRRGAGPARRLGFLRREVLSLRARPSGSSGQGRALGG